LVEDRSRHIINIPIFYRKHIKILSTEGMLYFNIDYVKNIEIRENEK
jgi:hypothetical protein